MTRPESLAEERAAFLGDDHVSVASSTTVGDYANDDLEILSKSITPTYHSRLAAWFRSRPRNLRRALKRYYVFNVLKYFTLIVASIFVATPIFFPSYTSPPAHYHELEQRCREPNAQAGCANRFNEKVFLSVSLYDDGGHLANGKWGKSLLDLIDLIGDKNVYLSIYENDSGEAGKAALMQLKSKVKSKNTIFYDEHVPLSDFPTVQVPDGTNRTKRLAYLSEMRNRALKPIDRFEEAGGIQFDKVLFLNDVAFHPVDAAHLLFSTNVGSNGRTQYLSTCALDYMNPFSFYDVYAMRDAEGFSNGLPIFPIFSSAGQALSRSDMLAQKDAVRVSSCWGGMVAMQAQYVQNVNSSLPNPQFQDIGAHVINPSRPQPVSAPVRFRYEPEAFYDACECCLFLADVAQVARKAGSQILGTYLNPYVRVAYKHDVLKWLPWVQRWERLFTIPHTVLSYLFKMPTHNPYRTVQEGDDFTEEIWISDKGKEGGHWELVDRKGRNGLFCGVREFQIIQQGERKDDINWENTKIPNGQTLHFPT